MTKPNAKYYFRDKRLAQRQKLHQKFLRPLALWVTSREPGDYFVNGVIFAGFWIVIRLAVIHFYSVVAAMPWVIMAIALVLAGASAALRRGKNDGSSD